MTLPPLLIPVCGFLIAYRRCKNLTWPERVPVKYNRGKSYKRHTILSTKNDPKIVSPVERVSQYKDELFTVSAGKLFYLACLEEVGLKECF